MLTHLFISYWQFPIQTLSDFPIVSLPRKIPDNPTSTKKQKNNQGASIDAEKKTIPGDKTAKAKAKKDVEKVSAVDDNAR